MPRCRCGRKCAKTSKRHCRTCLDRRSASARKCRAARLRAGGCANCARPRAPSSRRFCQVCLDGIHDSLKRMVRTRRANGQCIDCDKPAGPRSVRHCDKHLDRQLELQRSWVNRQTGA